MRFEEWLRQHSGSKMRVWTAEVPTDGGSNCSSGLMVAHEDFITIDQYEGGIVAVPNRSITSIMELSDSYEGRVKTLLSSLSEVTT